MNFKVAVLLATTIQIYGVIIVQDRDPKPCYFQPHLQRIYGFGGQVEIIPPDSETSCPEQALELRGEIRAAARMAGLKISSTAAHINRIVPTARFNVRHQLTELLRKAAAAPPVCSQQVYADSSGLNIDALNLCYAVEELDQLAGFVDRISSLETPCTSFCDVCQGNGACISGIARKIRREVEQLGEEVASKVDAVQKNAAECVSQLQGEMFGAINAASENLGFCQNNY